MRRVLAALLVACVPTAAAAQVPREILLSRSVGATHVVLTRQGHSTALGWTREDVSVECDLGDVIPSASARPHLAPAGVLLTWTAGTSVAEAALCRADGGVAWFGGAALSVSPTGTHLLVYTPPAAPLAEDNLVRLVSLGDGTERIIARGRPSAVRWRRDSIEISIEQRRSRIAL